MTFLHAWLYVTRSVYIDDIVLSGRKQGRPQLSDIGGGGGGQEVK